METAYKLNEKLIKLREQFGYTQKELAEKLGVTLETVSAWEAGTSYPNGQQLKALAKIYEMSVLELLGVEEIIEEVEVLDECGHRKTHHRVKYNFRWKPLRSKFGQLFNAVFPIVMIIAFLLLGFLAGLWQVAWILFLLVPVFSSLIFAIERKNPSMFAFPVLAAAIYLFLGMQWGLWHPWWVIFLTIPTYYSLCKLFKPSCKHESC